MTKHYFNQQEASCQSIEALLKNHQQELGGGNVLNITFLWGVNLSRQGKYKEAAELTQAIVDQLKAQNMDSAQLAGFQTVVDTYKMYNSIGNICRPLHPNKQYIIPILTDNKLQNEEGDFIGMNGYLNQEAKQLIFDTGAGMNIISSKDANECGLRKLNFHINMSGIGMQQGQVAIADTLRIGGTMWQNVPFLIVDIITGNAEADKIMAKGLAPVIGLPIMLQMKEMQLDFVNRTLTIPATPTPGPVSRPNLLRKDSEGLQMKVFDEHGLPLYFHLDTGSSTSLLSTRWYNNHKESVHATGQPDSLRMAGIGGVIQQQSYLMKNQSFQIGKEKAHLSSIHVTTGLDLHTNQPLSKSAFSSPDEDGVIGIDLLKRFARIVINLQDMYIEAIPR